MGECPLHYEIRQANIDDIKSIQEVARQSWASTYEGIIPKSVQEQFISKAYSDESMVRRVERTLLLVAECEGNIVGFANFSRVDEHKKVELIAIYMLSDYQKYGIGSDFLEEGIKHRSEAEALVAYVNSENTIGKAFYERKGFLATEEIEEELFGFKERLIKMVLNL